MGNVIDWSDERPRGRRRHRKGGLIDHEEVAREVRSQPSRWAKIADGLRSQQAHNLAYVINTGANRTWYAEGKFDAMSRKTDGETTYEVWALYMGDW